MGVGVKTNFTGPSDIMGLTSGVRLTVRRVLSGCEASGEIRTAAGRFLNTAMPIRDAVQWAQADVPVGIEAERVFLEEREPSFYLGFWEPSLRSELRGGIA